MYPVKILARQRTVREGSDLYVTCSIFGQKKYPSFYVYLLKDGQGFRKSKQEQALDDALFIISNLHLDHSGNYSCLYSTTNYSLSDVEGKGQNEVEILVIGEYLFILFNPTCSCFYSLFFPTAMQPISSQQSSP